jgi:hypothetical protein
VVNDGVWESPSSRPGQSASLTVCARLADLIDVHAAAITHNPACCPALVLTLALRHQPALATYAGGPAATVAVIRH